MDQVHYLPRFAVDNKVYSSVTDLQVALTLYIAIKLSVGTVDYKTSGFYA